MWWHFELKERVLAERVIVAYSGPDLGFLILFSNICLLGF